MKKDEIFTLADYERALRLYDFRVKSGEAPEYFAQRVEELKKVWKEKTE